MLDQEAIDQQLELLAAHRRTPAASLRQQADMGLLTPPSVVNGISDNNHKTMSTYIYRLRQKIEHNPAEPQHLTTVRNEGYMFVATDNYNQLYWTTSERERADDYAWSRQPFTLLYKGRYVDGYSLRDSCTAFQVEPIPQKMSRTAMR
jgi:hypothetical protein